MNKRAFFRAVCFMLALCFAAPCASAEEAPAPQVTTVSLDNIYALAYQYNVNAKIADLSLKLFYDGIEDLEDALDNAWALSRMSDPAAAAYGSQLLSSLAPKQVSFYQRESTELSIESTKRQIALAGQGMLVTYYSLGARYAGLEAAAAKLDRGIAVTQVMLRLGMATEDSMTELRRAKQELDAAMQSLSYAREMLTARLGLFIGVKPDVMAIAPFAGCTHAQSIEIIGTIDFDADLKLAEENCLALKIQALAVSGAASSQKSIERMTLDAMKQEFPAAVKQAYLDLKTRSADLLTAENVCQASARGAETAKLKLALGMISVNACADAMDQLASDESDLTAAQLNFIAAYNTYAALVNGFWQR